MGQTMYCIKVFERITY